MNDPNTNPVRQGPGRSATCPKSAVMRDWTDPRPSKVPRLDCPQLDAQVNVEEMDDVEEKKVDDRKAGGNGLATLLAGYTDDVSDGGANAEASEGEKVEDRVTTTGSSEDELDIDMRYSDLPDSSQDAVKEATTPSAIKTSTSIDAKSADSGGSIQGRTEKISIPLRTGEVIQQDLPPAAFILRPPVKPVEVDAVRKTMAEVLEEAHERIGADGYDAYRRWSMGDIDGEDDGGMDSEEEEEAERKKAEQSLKAAVVQGNPRGYQTELFEIAKARNTIVNLGTGQGKTLVALLLVRHLASPAFEEGKQTWFLVPSVALAVQHRTTLAANLPYTVDVACHSTSNTEGARRKLSEANIVVATHGSAMDLLNHYGDMFHFSRVNLLVVDECHYASGNHRYTHIMERHYHPLSPEQRPRVLGLTASPFVNVKRTVTDEKLETMLGSLERTLDCTLATLPGITGRGEFDDSEEEDGDGGGLEGEGDDITPKPADSAEERVVHYHSVKPAEPLPSHLDLNLHQSRIGEFNQLESLYNDLGPKATAVYSATLARECSRNKWMNETHEEFEKVKAHLWRVSDFCMRQCEVCPDGGRTEKLAVLEELLEDLVEGGGGGSGVGGKEKENDPVGVVFVNMRITALALYDYFRARKREMKRRSWVPVRDTRWSRKPKTAHAKAFVSPQQHLHDSSLEDPVAAAIRSASMMGIPDGLDMNPDIGLPPGPGVGLITASHAANGDSTDAESNGKYGPKNELRCEVLVRHCTQVFKYLDKSQQPLSKVSTMAAATGGVNKETSNSKAGGSGGSSEPWLHQQKKIRDVLDGMRRGETNVLIATSLVEEGVDVAACSFVVVFDALRSSKSYVQMKGRARRKDARLYVFQDSHPRSQTLKLTTLRTAQEVERRVKEFLEARGVLAQDNQFLAGILLPRMRYVGASLSAEEKALEEGEYRAANGVVDIGSAKGLLNRYAIGIPLDPSSRLSRERLLLHMPSYNDDDTVLTLPSHLPADVRCVELSDRYKYHGGRTNAGRRERQSMLALMACVRLHSLKLLNDRLLPLRHKDMHERLLKVALTRLPSFGAPLPQASPPNHGAGEENKEVYIYPLRQLGPIFSQHDDALKGNGRILCLISTALLPDEIPGLQFRHHELKEVSVEMGPPKRARLSASQWEECSRFYAILMNARFRKRSKNHWFRYSSDKAKTGVLIPHIVGCLDAKGALDWGRMRRVIKDYARSDQEREDAIAALNLDGLKELPEPRVVSPQYDPNIKYIVYGPSNLTCVAKFPTQDLEGVNTYEEYFRVKREHEVKGNCKLLAVQRFWHLPRRVLREKAVEILAKRAAEEEPRIRQLQEGERAPCSGLVSCLLPQEACIESQFLSDASLFLHSVQLPHILFHTDRVLQTQAFVDYCLERLPVLGNYLKEIPLEELMSAITAKSCTLDTNYDKLEWLGDAVLKLVHTDTLLHSRELRKWVAILHEGDLSSLRSAMGSNARLKDAAQSSGINRYVLIFSLGRGQWVPSCLELYVVTEDGKEFDAPIESVQPSDKVSADIMESLLGLIYVHFGFQASVNVAVELGISLPRDPDMATKPTVTPKGKLLTLAKTFLGKGDFGHPELLEEALTHPSAIHEDVPNYQRLEWVGDAVLCLAAREYVYRNYSYLGLAEMNIVESTFVCNETLAYLCVKSGLSLFINHRDPCLPSRLEEFQRNFRQDGRGLWGTDPPKVLGDVVESMVGAAHVDGGFCEGQKAVLFVLKPIIDTVTLALQEDGDEYDPNKKANDIFMHPKQELHEMAGGILQIKAWKEEDYAGRRLRCPLWCGDSWGEATEQGTGAVGVVQSLGINIIAALEPNSQVAKNRACALAVFAFHQSPELMEKLKAIAKCISTAKEVDPEDEE